jgi:hypothetical protein
MHLSRGICERRHIGLVGIMEGEAFGWEYMILTLHIVPTLDCSSMSVKYDLIGRESPPWVRAHMFTNVRKQLRYLPSGGTYLMI